MSPLVPLALFGWPIAVLAMFTLLTPRRAVSIGMIGAWLFLPNAGYGLPGLPDITKMSITCYSVFVGTVLFDPTRFSTLRPTLTDAALIAWLLAPLLSAITAGYGPYEGVSGVLNQTVSWGLPYLIGRLYFSDAQGLRALAMAIFIGGVIYVPLVLFEAKMSPVLHSWIYGFHQHQFAQARRGEGWRPTVFMQHGLAVAMFMGTAAVCGIWLWIGGGLRVMRHLPVWLLAMGLLVVAATCRSTYALMLTLVGSMALVASRVLKARSVLALLLSVAPLYMIARTFGGWDAQLLRDIAGLMGEDRGGSLDVRLVSENVCWKFMQSNLLFGDCRMDRLMLRDSPGERFIPDALWLIVLTKNGLFGILALYGFLLLPVVAYLSRFRPADLFGKYLCGATIAATVLILYVMDSLLNAMVNPIYLLGAGGLAGFMASRVGTVPSHIAPRILPVKA
jgi:hypothetical protein